MRVGGGGLIAEFYTLFDVLYFLESEIGFGGISRSRSALKGKYGADAISESRALQSRPGHVKGLKPCPGLH